ncbi:beta-1,3-galactosyltransferase 9 [Uranotaenia lowii]|uniref:beta-1,3-galactosyltransferase 9 n=1 Tax=Uranotaenia lowii TaxID=190385 RepID=UPI0024795838|nr:beta-1,3-galactosyltransferase 9 [Uranotaenia lowii]XP_055606720.1 beta-1,3-galactosyltransferase 9 [Uranotaenia lowii]
MFERRPLFGALVVLTLLITGWHMSFQEANSTSTGGIGNGLGGAVPSFEQQQPIPSLTASPLSSKGGGGGIGESGEDTRPLLYGQALNQSFSPVPPWPTLLVLNAVETLPIDDYSSLIDLKDFRFTINFNNCTSANERRKRESTRSDSLKGDERWTPLILVLVHSAPSNWYKRNTIRDTWGQFDPRAKLVFLLGAVNSTTLQRRIEEENRQHDDIVQGNFIDAYRNMTYKHVMALKWFTYHCPEAKYILKADDDVFVNTPVLYDSLESYAQRSGLLFCQKISRAAVKRTYRSKWFVSIREYPNKYYPNHCPGYSIIYTPDVAFQLYKEAQQQPYFWIDDVHLTGTIANRVNVTITPTGSKLLNATQKEAIIDRRLNASDQPFFFTTPDLRDGDIRKLWQAVSISAKSTRIR